MYPIFDNLYVFEIANNHQGEVSHGQAIIKALGQIVRKHNIRAAVKFQYRDLDTFIHPDFASRTDIKHIPRFQSTRLAPKEFKTLLDYVREQGMATMVTPFDERSVERCLEHDVDILKIASCSCTDWPLLEEIAKAGKPVISSTGGRTFRDMDRIVNFFEHRNVQPFAMLHCIGIYPAPIETIHLGFMRKMMDRYPDVTIGYSAHEAPAELDVVRAAVAMGAQILERHVGLATEKHKLNAYSLGPAEIDEWVAAAQRVRIICNAPTRDKSIPAEEAKSLRELTRGTFAAVPIKKGQTIPRSSVFFAMPVIEEGQTTTTEYAETMTATRDYAKGQPLFERRDETSLQRVRDVVHEAKSMLREAKIAIGPTYSVELSHHYGMDSFREVGVILVNLINREYCKKLGILLPGQRHPMHRHMQKEETFQILRGAMTLVVEGVSHDLKAGDTCLVGRNQRHSFQTATGCIFEEVSTTSIAGDSIYDDPVVARLDPIQRKTVLESW